jgi:DNA ligase-1
MKIYAPMLAKEHDPKKVKYSCFVQPKLDGMRCVVQFLGGMPVAHSRNGKIIELPTHIAKTLEMGYAKYDDPDEKLVLDGELYIHGQSFQEVLSRVKRVKNGRHPDVQSLDYCVYDTIDEEKDFNARSKDLHYFTSLCRYSDAVVFVETIHCITEKDVNDCHEKFVGRGYEGSMIRTLTDKYACDKRSWSLMKRKDWLEEDFDLISISEGEGKNAGTGVLCLRTHNGVRFSATAPGNYAEKERWWTDRNEILRTGKKVSVKFQNWTDNGTPRFPEALGIKEDR